MWPRKKRNCAGITPIEMASVLVILALLLAMGFMVYRGMRLAARAATAENNLRQISTGMELYFRRYATYPPQGSDLTVVLAPFVESPNVFNNPLMEETTPGQTINNLYCAPSVGDLDRPNHFLTGMVADNGRTAVILWTGHRVDRRDDIPFNPANPGAYLLAVLNPTVPSAPVGETPADGSSGGETGTSPDTTTGSVDGSLNINPSNSTDFEFVLTKADSSTITRDDLLASKGNLAYKGEAITVRVRPHGNGNQNTITLGGVAYPLKNGTLYTITSDSMSVNLYNRKSGGKGSSMGQFWIDIAAKSAAITYE